MSRRPPLQRVAAAVVIGGLALGGCSLGELRLETDPPQAPVPDTAEQLRQDNAATAARIAATAGEIAAALEAELSAADPAADGDTGDEADPGAALLAHVTQIEAAAAEHQAALGGIWQAWPEGAPEGSEQPPAPETAALADATPAALHDLLLESAELAWQEALSAPQGPQAAMLGAITLNRTLDAAELADVAGLDVESEPLPRSPLPVAALMARGVDGPTVAVLDQARFLYETVAARSSDGTRDNRAARADHFQLLVDAALAGGATDSRQTLYPLPQIEGRSPNESAIITAEAALLEHAIFSLSRTGQDGELREDLLAAAADSAWRMTAAGAELPAMPGYPAG